MGSNDFSHDYIVRIYRFEKDKPRSLVGLVEEVGKRGKRGFNSFDELWEILNSSTKDPKDTPSPLAGRISRSRGEGGGKGGGD
ncbi:MAG: hypothetical protein HXY44_09875 [Syntrophaceae bacterium]|nr:hypothetical protein [Syntrophaceae bacterium]